MQPEYIETFLDLVETRSFNRTAERLGITQSTVSARVAALETRVGRKLFERSRAGTSLTTAGLSFEPHARDLRHSWSEALRSLQDAGNVALSMRIGLQTDLAGSRIGAWVASFREVLPETAFYIEIDYSNQMSLDLAEGRLNLAVMFSPRAMPDLHLESVGEVRYRLISSDGVRVSEIVPGSYIRGAFSHTFDKQHTRHFPQFANSLLACGDSATMVGLLKAIGGAGYVLESEAAPLLADGGFAMVEDAPVIPQTIYVAIHVRHRHSHASRRLMTSVQRHLSR